MGKFKKEIAHKSNRNTNIFYAVAFVVFSLSVPASSAPVKGLRLIKTEDRGFAALASNQTRRVKLVNLKTQKTIKTQKGDKTVAQAILSPGGKGLYSDQAGASALCLACPQEGSLCSPLFPWAKFFPV